MNVQINKSILAGVLCWSISLSVLAQAGTYSGGDGTEASPYRISTVNDWMELIGTSADWNKHFILTATIDFEGAAITPVAPDTDPSNHIFDGTPFTGMFDGGGYVLKNFVIDQPDGEYVGLFGQVGSGGQVRNLGVEPLQVTGRGLVGGLCGINSEGTITYCYATGAVSGDVWVGGLCGYNYGTITSCYATGTVSGTGYVGGLCGENWLGPITSCYATGAVSGTDLVGGLCGWDNYSTITSCYATGAVSGVNYVGGLCGWDNYSTITSCYATGTVSGTEYVGGLCGGNSYATISTSYATGTVSGTGFVGGLCGENGGTISSSFWDTQTSGMTTSSGGTGKTSAEMKTLSTFTNAGWDFVGETANGTDDIWWMRCEGMAYPRLSWEILSIGAYSGGDGTAENPYQISTVCDWLVLLDTSADWNKHFILTASIDVGATITPVAPDTDPSTSGFQGTPFTGMFDGGGYVLKNFVIDQPASDYVGLFGQVGSGGQVRNLGVESLQVTGRGPVGGLCGENWYGTITSCYATGTVSGDSAVGGLCGENWYGTITSCYATGAVSGNSAVGGLCGENFSHSTITSCYATGAVSGSFDVGGLCGWNMLNSTIISCYATGTVIGDFYVGGLCGENYDTITSCYATGTVSGYLDVGGLCGGNYGGTISTSFWDTQTTGWKTSDGGTGKTTDEMQTQSTFTLAGWDFTNETFNGTNDTWRMCANGVDYPRLNWESTEGDFECPDGVNTEDLNYYVSHWLMNNCTSSNNYCSGTDLNYSGVVDLVDWSIFAEKWLSEI